MKKKFGSLSVITLFALALTFASCKKKEEVPPPPASALAQSQRRHRRRAMLNPIHQLLTRHLVQKKEEPKAKQAHLDPGHTPRKPRNSPGLDNLITVAIYFPKKLIQEATEHGSVESL